MEASFAAILAEMVVSDRDRRKMSSISRDLKLAETDEEPSDDRRREILAWANADRARRGLPALSEEDRADPPEEELYRRARALGMVGANHRRS